MLLRPLLFDETDVVTTHNPVNDLGSVLYSMNLFNSENYVGPRRIFCLIDGTNPKIRDDVILFNLPNRVLIPQLVERERAKVRGHHVERFRKASVGRLRRVSEVMLKKPPH